MVHGKQLLSRKFGAFVPHLLFQTKLLSVCSCLDRLEYVIVYKEANLEKSTYILE